MNRQKTYAVKEIYRTLQGEGAHTGRVAVFLRFSGCNLWTGLERDRDTAVCTFCDTDFVGTDGPSGGRYNAQELASRVREIWNEGHAEGVQSGTPYVVCTGGEPLLQLDEPLIEALHDQGFEVAVETNGTQPAPSGLDWICVSPKADAPLRLSEGDELKLVYPQPSALPERFADLDFTHFFLQPLDGPNAANNTRTTIAYCEAHPQWRLSLQTHKLIGIP